MLLIQTVFIIYFQLLDLVVLYETTPRRQQLITRPQPTSNSISEGTITMLFTTEVSCWLESFRVINQHPNRWLCHMAIDLLLVPIQYRWVLKLMGLLKDFVTVKSRNCVPSLVLSPCEKLRGVNLTPLLNCLDPSMSKI